MSPLDVLIVAAEGEAMRLDALAVAARRAGHRVALVESTDAALGQPTPDVLVVSQAAGFELAKAFDLPTGSPHTIALGARRDYDELRAALHAGFDEHLVVPTADEFVLALEAAPAERAPAPEPLDSFQRSYAPGPTQARRVLLDLLAFGTRAGVERSVRFRAGTALAELIANTTQHAYADSAGPLELSARIANERLVVVLGDHGLGFADDATGRGSEASGPRGLDLARSLTERLEIVSTTSGSRVSAEFQLAPACFDEDDSALDELDHFDPATTRAVLALASEHGAALPELSPAVATTLGRLLGARSLATQAHCALWS